MLIDGHETLDMTGTMHRTSVNMPESLREHMVALCNQQLANTFDLYSQTKQAHWNVKGIHCSDTLVEAMDFSPRLSVAVFCRRPW